MKKNWGVFSLFILLMVIVFLNVKPGYFVMGNDNFSPEIRPDVTLERSLFSPAWRAYRVLGIPSDSEQSDIFRTAVFSVFSFAFPGWLLSQGYLFFTFIIASISMGLLTGWFVEKLFGEGKKQYGVLIGGVFYMANMLTSWIYFFPVHLFVAAYAFLPFLLWRLQCFLVKPSLRSVLLLVIASLLLATAALTATMYLVCTIVILFFTFLFFVYGAGERKKKFFFLGLFFTIGIQLFWLLPFGTYVVSNTKPLQDSAINRQITATTIENEARFNTAVNVPRYYSSWMDTKENTREYTFPYRDWYKTTLVGNALSSLPIIFLCIGGGYLLYKRNILGILILPVFFGWFVIKGINAPLGSYFEWFQASFPVVAQVFRWQSSKLWPLLGMAIPILASVGVLATVGFLSSKTHAWKRIVDVVAVGGIMLLLLFFVHPYFQGDLVRKRVYVAIPNEYFQLAQYLDANDRFGRIYLAPEANTLYFRNYSWGFWGSVVLNYLLRNPIIEKALIIGSYENEQAFTVLTNAYYSEDAETFVNALWRYEVSYVLVDGNVEKGDVGYAYNQSISEQVIGSNRHFKKIWSEGKLTLYQVEKKDNEAAWAYFPQSDPITLNLLHAASGELSPYFLQYGRPGILYPFALMFDEIEFKEGEIIGSMKYRGSEDDYVLSLRNSDLQNAPSLLTFDRSTGNILMNPLYPEIRVNKKRFTYHLPRRKFKVDSFDDARFLSINDYVLDLSSHKSGSYPLSGQYNRLSSGTLMQFWTASPLRFLLDPEYSGRRSITCGNKEQTQHVRVAKKGTLQCATETIVVNKASIIEMKLTLESTKKIRATLCLESANKKGCMNANTSTFLSSSSRTFTINPRTIVQGGDGIKLFVNFTAEDEATEVGIRDVVLQFYVGSSKAVFEGEEKVFADQAISVPLKSGDMIHLHIPVLLGANAWQLESGALLPELAVVPFEKEEKSYGSVDPTFGGGLHFINKNSNSSVFPQISLVDVRGGQGVGMVAFKATHESGVPLELSVHDTNQEYKLWQQQIRYKMTSESLDLFLLPKALRSYYVEAFSTGIGPRESKNELQSFVFQVIPQSWLNLHFIPQKETKIKEQQLTEAWRIETNTYSGKILSDTQHLVTIPTAVSRNWRLSIGGSFVGDSAIVNGWQQGWVTERSGDAFVWFLPNLLVYVGFLPLIGVAIWLVVMSVRRMRRGRK